MGDTGAVAVGDQPDSRLLTHTILYTNLLNMAVAAVMA